MPFRRRFRPSGVETPRTTATRSTVRSQRTAEWVEDSFCREVPSPRAAVELFAGQWSSRLPAPYEELTGAATELFADGRITWAVERLGGVTGMRVIELGPLEGGHTFMLGRLGAAEITAVEANRRAYLRCLVAKEILGMPSSRFLLGDFVGYLQAAVAEGSRWDLCLAVGVLYHQQDPVALLELATAASDRLLLWTHYYDEEVLSVRPDHATRFSGSSEHVTAGFPHRLYRHEYGRALRWQGFCGGLASWSSWMSRAELFGAIEHLGFSVTGTAFDDLRHPNGPALCLIAERCAPGAVRRASGPAHGPRSLGPPGGPAT